MKTGETSAVSVVDGNAAPDAVLHFRAAVAAGTPWHRALLEAMALWTLPEESHDGRRYKYLLQGGGL